MSMSNRFELETLARQRQAGLERRLRHAAVLAATPQDQPPVRRVNLEAGAIMTAAAAASLVLALGLSSLFALAFAIVR